MQKAQSMLEIHSNEHGTACTTQLRTCQR